jgi:WhiB family transcriptional regulator, redox-sensing transcriptional regulator
MIERNGKSDLERVISENPTWRDEAQCHVDPDRWFPEPGSHSLEERRICVETCPVRAQCLASGLLTDEHFGIWGGLTVSAIRKARKERSRAVRAGSAPKSVDHYLGVAANGVMERVEEAWEQADIDLHEWSQGST